MAEGVQAEATAEHPDWRLWLWDAGRARAVVRRAQAQKAVP
jgi:hypothetical protein